VASRTTDKIASCHTYDIKGEVTAVTILEVPQQYRQQQIWIVTYDLPSSGAVQKERRRFYRHLQKWLREHPKSGTVWMTMSTVITRSREFARFVMEEIDGLGLAGARASMYQANLLAFIGKPQQFTTPTLEQIRWMSEG